MKSNYKAMIKILGILTLTEGLFMIPCLAAAIHFGEWKAGSAFFEVAVAAICVGFVIVIQSKFEKITLRPKETYFIACMSWIYCSLLGALPFYFCGEGFSFISCYFESVAGFSTTGCSVIDTNMIPSSLLLWRSMCHWLGGMGVLVLLISVFPLWGVNSQSVAIAETPGLSSEKFTPKYSDMGRFLYKSYALLSLAEFILLVLGPMDWFTALLTTFSSISTAGLTITDETAWLFNLLYVRAVILLFTVLSSLNFILYFMAAKGKWSDIFKNIETRVFLAIITAATVLITFSLKLSGTYDSLWQAFKDGLCQVISFISTSGFFVKDYTTWPAFAVTVLFMLLFVGGCSFSTSGSLKVIRVTILFKLMKRGMLKQIHPNMVKAIMLKGKPVSAPVAASVAMHALLYFGILAIGCILLSFNGLGMETTLTTAIGAFSNAGVAMNGAGNFGYFGMFNGFSQLVMTFLMISGRLEMYSIVMLFTKSFWKHNKANVI